MIVKELLYYSLSFGFYLSFAGYYIFGSKKMSAFFITATFAFSTYVSYYTEHFYVILTIAILYYLIGLCFFILDFNKQLEKASAAMDEECSFWSANFLAGKSHTSQTHKEFMDDMIVKHIEPVKSQPNIIFNWSFEYSKALFHSVSDFISTGVPVIVDKTEQWFNNRTYLRLKKNKMINKKREGL